MAKYIHYPDNEIKLWYDEYLKTYRILDVSKKFGVGKDTVYRRLKKYERIHGLNEINISNSKKIYSYDDDFFTKDTPESFYWAGFIAADGCVHNKHGNYELKIGLAKKDSEHLIKFSKAIKYSGEVKYISVLNKGKIRDFATIAIYGKKYIEDLRRFGIVERKSLILKFPTNLENHPLINHFIRGYIDGDGCFSYNHKSKYRPKICLSMCGTYSFLNSVRRILSNKCQTNKKIKIQNRNKISVLAYSGNKNVSKIRNFLYNNSNPNIELARKKEIAYSSWVDAPTINAAICVRATSIVNGTTILFKSINEIHKRGFTENIVRRCLRGERKDYKNYIWEFENITKAGIK